MFRESDNGIRAHVYQMEGDSGGRELLGAFPCWMDAKLFVEKVYVPIGKYVGGDSALLEVIFEPADVDGTFYQLWDARKGDSGECIRNKLIHNRRAEDPAGLRFLETWEKVDKSYPISHMDGRR